LIAVEATVRQLLRTTAQNVTAVLTAVLLAFLTARTLGVEWYSLGLLLVVALGVARSQRLGGSGLQVPPRPPCWR
jgi:Na+/H+ antiporter NhaC